MIEDIGLVIAGWAWGWAVLVTAGVTYLRREKRRALKAPPVSGEMLVATLLGGKPADPYAQYRTSRDGEP